MGHAHHETCPQCARPVDGALGNCRHCGNALPDAARHSDVPPALAVAVTLGLVGGVAVLALLVGRFLAKPEAGAHQPLVPPSALAASPAPSAKASLKPVARATPASLPGGPAAGHTLPSGPVAGGEPPSIGMPPAAPIPYKTGTPASPVSTGPRYPGPP